MEVEEEVVVGGVMEEGEEAEEVAEEDHGKVYDLPGTGESGGLSGDLLLFVSQSLAVALVLHLAPTIVQVVWLAAAVSCHVLGYHSVWPSVSSVLKGGKSFTLVFLYIFLQV